jgi:hypothetical protein
MILLKLIQYYTFLNKASSIFERFLFTKTRLLLNLILLVVLKCKNQFLLPGQLIKGIIIFPQFLI